MDAPAMFESRTVAENTTALVSYFPLPGLGVLPINAFLIHGVEPVLIDTGMAPVREGFMRALRASIQPETIRWICLTHIDPDHVGNLRQVMVEAPHARIVTTFLGMGKLALLEIPLERVYLLNPGQRLELPDRTLVVVKPPTFDAPETTALFDLTTRTLFSADCFGALMQEPAEDAAAIPGSMLREGLVLWSTLDVPWLHLLDGQRFEAALDRFRELAPTTIASSHLPPATGMLGALIDYLRDAGTVSPFVGPDQAALERMLGTAASP